MLFRLSLRRVFSLSGKLYSKETPSIFVRIKKTPCLVTLPIYNQSKCCQTLAPQTLHLFKHLENDGISSELSANDIEKLTSENPKLNFVSAKTFKEITAFLLSNGFDINQAKDMFFSEPTILELKPESFQNCINAIRRLEVGENKTLTLFHSHPRLFLINPSKIVLRYKTLDQIFPHKDIRKIMLQSPQVLYQNLNDIRNKINYILFKMGLDQGDVVESEALSYSLEYIQARHQLLERTGFYKKPNPKNKHVSKNLKLRKILHMNDIDLVKYCLVSLEEFNVLAEMLEKEEIEEFELDSENESD